MPSKYYATYNRSSKENAFMCSTYESISLCVYANANAYSFFSAKIQNSTASAFEPLLSQYYATIDANVTVLHLFLKINLALSILFN